MPTAGRGTKFGGLRVFRQGVINDLANPKMAVFALYAVVVARAGAFLRGSRVRRAIDGTAGVALIGLGIKVAVEER